LPKKITPMKLVHVSPKINCHYNGSKMDFSKNYK